MAGLCEGGNEPPGSLKAISNEQEEKGIKWLIRQLKDSLSSHLLGRVCKQRGFQYAGRSNIPTCASFAVDEKEGRKLVKGLDRPAGCWPHAHMPKQRWTIIQAEWRYRVVSAMIPQAVIAGIRNRISLPIVAPQVHHDAGSEELGREFQKRIADAVKEEE
ncbi:hypothetical protein ANN_15438 [Periplaneta americana]|uniref:Uncharacterized protein n=1 Tax=Periplaneta americana TaxID=6978 RepID=A0ABQ8SGE0_PERAM|nr:hypothetical protein ANN_15438 [Periplaneta americana]